MLIYRVAWRYSVKVGPYTSKVRAILGDVHTQFGRAFDSNPPPFNDKPSDLFKTKFLGSCSYYFGFQRISFIDQWFIREEQIELHNRGFKLWVVESSDYLPCESQIAFNGETAKVIGRYPLLPYSKIREKIICPRPFRSSLMHSNKLSQDFLMCKTSSAELKLAAFSRSTPSV